MEPFRTRVATLYVDDIAGTLEPTGRFLPTTTLLPAEKDRPFRSLFTERDLTKILYVTDWVKLKNPTIGTCRNCNVRAIVDDPLLGLYGMSTPPPLGPPVCLDPGPSHTCKYGGPWPVKPLLANDDLPKLSRVRGWKEVDSPMYGSCRMCGHRGLVDQPMVGLY